MQKYNIPVDFTVYATDAAHAQKQIDLYLKQSYRELAASYNVMDYELPVGYPMEKSDGCCSTRR